MTVGRERSWRTRAETPTGAQTRRYGGAVGTGEYEFYEFRALDRPLDDAAYDQVRALLPGRARVTRRRALGGCSPGEFTGERIALMEHPSAAHLCETAAGIRMLMIRLPLGRFDLDAAAQYTFIDSGPARPVRMRGPGDPFTIRRSDAH